MATAKKAVKKAVKEEVKVVKVTEVEKITEFTGSLLLKSEPFEFCPENVLVILEFPEDVRPVFVLKPFTAKIRHWIEQEDCRVKSEVLMWFMKEGFDFNYVAPKKDATEDEKRKEKNLDELKNLKAYQFSDNEKKSDFVRQSIIGIKNSNGIFEFEKSTDQGLSIEKFNKLPIEIVNTILKELLKRTSLVNQQIYSL